MLICLPVFWRTIDNFTYDVIVSNVFRHEEGGDENAGDRCSSSSCSTVGQSDGGETLVWSSEHALVKWFSRCCTVDQSGREKGGMVWSPALV